MQAIHPLRDFFPRAGDVAALAACWPTAIAGSASAREPPAPRPAASCSSKAASAARPGRSSWPIRARASRGAASVVPYVPPAPIPLGTGIRAEIFEPRFVDGVLDGPDARRGRLQLRRSLTLAERDGQADITFRRRRPRSSAAASAARRRAGLDWRPPSSAASRPTRLRQAPTAAAGTGLPRLHPRQAGRARRRPRPAYRAPGARPADRPWPAVLIVLAWTASLLLARLELFHRRPILWTILGLLQLLLALRL
jgi:hypothetical protein